MADVDTGYGKPDKLRMSRDLAPELANGPKWQRSPPTGTGYYMPKTRFNGYIKKGIIGLIAALLISVFSAGGAWFGMQNKVEGLVKTLDEQKEAIDRNEERIRVLENCINSNIPVMQATLINLKEGQDKLDNKIDRLDYKLDKYNRR